MSATQALTFSTIVVAGFTSCAEFGSFAFVHPVLRRLPYAQQVLVEQGLVRTFGRVMPFLMTGSLMLLVAWASLQSTAPGVLVALCITCWAVGLASTVVVNVGINVRTARWRHTDESSWAAMRRRWELFQGVRASAFLASFVLLSAAVTTA